MREKLFLKGFGAGKEEIVVLFRTCRKRKSISTSLLSFYKLLLPRFGTYTELRSPTIFPQLSCKQPLPDILIHSSFSSPPFPGLLPSSYIYPCISVSLKVWLPLSCTEIFSMKCKLKGRLLYSASIGNWLKPTSPYGLQLPRRFLHVRDLMC